MTSQGIGRVALAFLAAVILATVWGSIVQTQYNLAGLGTLGVPITAGLRTGTTLRDIFSGFSPTYAGFIVLPSLLVAFAVAWFFSGRVRGPAMAWFALAGTLAIVIGIPLVNQLSPVALLVGATRDFSCTMLMALGGGVGGLLFAWLTQPGQPRAAPRRAHANRVA
jgi:hypothetical protein